jgi:hypothetical protein
VTAIQPRPVELWLKSLALSPKGKAHVRNMLYMLLAQRGSQGLPGAEKLAPQMGIPSPLRAARQLA